MAKHTETLADRIKTLRKEKKMTQLELSELLNVTDKAVSKWETNEGNPDISLLSKLSEIFNVTIDYLLTGKIPEEKVLLISKAEYCAKNDDVSLLDDLINNPPKADESGNTLFDYIMRYQSLKVFKKLVEDKKIDFFLSEEIQYSFKKRTSNARLEKRLIRRSVGTDVYDSYDILIMLIKSDSLSSLPTLGIGRIEDACYFEWDKRLYEYVVNQNLSKSTLDKIFLDTLGDDGLWAAIYSKYIELALEKNNTPLLDYLINKVKVINKNGFDNLKTYTEKKARVLSFKNRDLEEIERYARDKGRSIDCFSAIRLSTEPAPLINNDYRLGNSYEPENKLFFVGLSKKSLEIAKEKNFDVLNDYNELNKEVKSYSYDDKTMELIKMKLNKTHSDDEIFIKSCMDGELLNIERILESPSLALIKKTLNTYPIHYFEVLEKLIKNKEYKKLFEISVDLGDSDLRTIVLTEQYKLLENSAYYISTNRLAKLPNTNRVQLQNMKFAKELFDKNNHKNELYSDSISLKAYLNKTKELIISEVSWKIDTEQLVSELTKEFFMEKLDNNQDLLIIKLCLLLEAKLKVNYALNGDLSEMIDKYIRLRFYEEDGDGYEVQSETYTPNILHKVRIMRNNLVHSQKTAVKSLERQELIDAINHIIEM